MEQQVLPPFPLFRSYSHSPNSPPYFHDSIIYVPDCRDANAVLTMGQETAMAKTDGSLQIQIPDKDSPGGSIPWTRQYYAVPLEVPTTPDTLNSLPLYHILSPTSIRISLPWSLPARLHFFVHGLIRRRNASLEKAKKKT